MICERCDRKIDEKTGWGGLMVCAIQAQPGVGPRQAIADEREQSLFMCGYCLHELAAWLCPEIEEERA